MKKWGDVLERAVEESAQPPTMTIHDKSGRVLLHTPIPTDFAGHPVLYSNRGLLQHLIYEHATSLNIKFRFGTRVNQYFEEENCAGVIIDGERIEADGVVAADGVHSTARADVMGIKQRPRSSGFAVFRTCFSLDRLAGDPITKQYVDAKEDRFHVWLGPDVHAILFVIARVKQVVIFCTHRVSQSHLSSVVLKA
jgi:2-polyprenyl-6-methoxyphenol hydroxylase-like FAD-dependent oxidoreductase